MNDQDIKILINKYWECKTNIEEEKILRSYFAKNTSHESFPHDIGNWFSAADNIQRVSLSNEFDRKIFEKIELQNKKNKKKRTLIWSGAISFAAIGLLLITLNIKNNSPVNEMTQQEAFDTARNILYFSSSKINEAETRITKELNGLKFISKNTDTN